MHKQLHIYTNTNSKSEGTQTAVISPSVFFRCHFDFKLWNTLLTCRILENKLFLCSWTKKNCVHTQTRAVFPFPPQKQSKIERQSKPVTGYFPILVFISMKMRVYTESCYLSQATVYDKMCIFRRVFWHSLGIETSFHPQQLQEAEAGTGEPPMPTSARGPGTEQKRVPCAGWCSCFAPATVVWGRGDSNAGKDTHFV